MVGCSLHPAVDKSQTLAKIEEAHGAHVVHNHIAALHIHPRDVGNQPMQEESVFWRVRTGRIRVHLEMHMLCHTPVLPTAR